MKTPRTIIRTPIAHSLVKCTTLMNWGKGIRGTGEKVFALSGTLSVGYYSCLYLVPGERYLRYRGKGIGTGEKVLEVPGIKRFTLI